MKLFLIDGHALIFKMYYAFLARPMVNSKGEDTSILFGFTKYLLELIEHEHPTHIAVSFDPPGGTFRNEMYPEYKANRGETPQLVIDALEPLTAIVKALNIPVLMIKGFEADDVIGSAAVRFASEGLDVYMVTPDKDYGQLIAPHIYQYKPGKSGSENEVIGVPEVCEKWQISSPLQVIDVLALCGDSADNVPGVQGIGPVSASKLLAKYGTVEAIYAHIDELTASQKAKFLAASDHIELSKKLVTIKTDIPLDVTAQDLVLNTSYCAEILSLIERYELNSLKRHVRNLADSLGTAVDPEPVSKGDWKPGREISPSAVKGERIAMLLDGDNLYLAGDGWHSCGSVSDFKGIISDPGVTKVGFDLKALSNKLALAGLELRGRFEDVELMHYLLNPERSHKIDVLAKSYLGVDLGAAAETVELDLFSSQEAESSRDCGKEVEVIYALAACLNKDLDASAELRKLYDGIEAPLAAVLARMEQAGVKVDLASLREYSESLRVRMNRCEAEVRAIAGEPELNVSSPKQIGNVIFEKLALDPKAKKPKSGNWPTDEQTLLELADRSPIIDQILEYRGLRKLISTYIEPFPGYVSPRDGRVHTTFNQALTSTGRLSSSNPNLQNIPIRTEDGREIRKAFVAEGDDSVIMSADYSQIELRLMAHFCGDEHLVSAFREGVDVHSATAARIFGIPVEEVTADQRRVAKTANFGIMYGISSFGLSQRLHCSRSEAKKIIDDYFASFPSIRNFIDTTVADARTKGYVETLFGRRRYIADINSHNATVRGLAERNAVNAPIQGTAADIIKLAMIAVDKALIESGLKSRMVLQIHDELLLEVPLSEVDAVKEILVKGMENVIELSVPLTVECNYGKTWLDAH